MVYAALSYKRLSGSATSKLGKHNGHPACSYIVFFFGRDIFSVYLWTFSVQHEVGLKKCIIYFFCLQMPSTNVKNWTPGFPELIPPILSKEHANMSWVF